MENKYLTQLKKLVLDELKSQNVKIFIFGSRARGDNYIGSDVDIGLISKGKIDSSKISLLKEKIENSNIPYKVEIVNFNEVSEDFKNEALKDIEIWKD
ncbi:MAG: nucleotidyltransferase domain-containing protein [Candidatus Melainabacteria bacterium]|nr:nucleotidyltransferase domain-containing protein [Candidatus Melainabacteria bacterium]